MILFSHLTAGDGGCTWFMQTRLMSCANVMTIAATLRHSLVDFFILYISAETARTGGGGRGFGSNTTPPPFCPPPVQSGLQPLQLAPLFTGQSADSSPPPLFSIPYMPLLLNEQSKLTPSAERKPVQTQEGKESAAWKEGPENRGRQERGEKEEEWQDREGGGHMESGFCIHDILVGHT